MKIEWHQWTATAGRDAPANRLNLDIKELEALPFAPLDFRYVALRDIRAGEELLLSYGERWERAWMSHLDELKAWSEKYDADSIAMKPQFREPITAPAGFFPPNFKSDCIGSTGCKKTRANRRSNSLPKHSLQVPDIELAREHAKSYFRFFGKTNEL